MKEYEVLYVADPATSDQDLGNLNEKIGQAIKKFEGKVLTADSWGKRLLAYPIQKKREGLYYYLSFLSLGGAIAEVERLLKLDERILRFMTIQIDAKTKENESSKEVKKSEKEDPEGDAKEFRFDVRRRRCLFCSNKEVKIDYKNGKALKPFITERFKLVPRRMSNLCAYHQRKMTVAIKRARVVALLPFSSVQVEIK